MKCYCLESWSPFLTRSSGQHHHPGAENSRKFQPPEHSGSHVPAGPRSSAKTHSLCFWKTILGSFSQQPPRLPRIHCAEKGLFLSNCLILICGHSTMSSGTGKSIPWHLDGSWVKGLRWILTPWLTERKGGSDSPPGSFPWSFLGESWLSTHIWGVERKNISQGSQNRSKENEATASALEK